MELSVIVALRLSTSAVLLASALALAPALALAHLVFLGLHRTAG